MRILGLPTVRTAAVAAAVLALVVVASPASADSITTRSGQTLSITVGASGLDQPQLVTHGTARISSGPTTIRSVVIRIDQGDPIAVEPDAQGHFTKGVVLAFDLTSVQVEAIATASDGSTVNAIVALASDGTVTRPASPDKSTGKRTLAPTGLDDPPVLGPLGLLLVLTGVALVQWSRRDEDPDQAA
ncbi:hypothetical protein [Nocardioides marmorisolisilvae]|uniref:LPXTG cell wall anchor domain-containing protein n=1 Tax=Nocardioides marmorisolisilvae TaxID=1542737 RepID=A0A3N0DPU2_9ACTN|nr:hypothetical protein [Nocardioides marmorisolisilvae]RNL77466.1 hypothetical protein EFL95_15670 [Nocardioides marmorisolisilvae]